MMALASIQFREPPHKRLHIITLTMLLASDTTTLAIAETPGTKIDSGKAVEKTLPKHPAAITSFGAAKIDDRVYTFGGHLGKPHHYYAEGQNDKLRMLDLKSPASWKEIANGPGLQGLALVAHAGSLYRVGGFEARNSEDDEQDLHSTTHFARFDFSSNQWKPLQDLPDGRSSFDAIVQGDTLYVVGGWTMSGDEEKVWRDDALSKNLADDSSQWMALPEPPFQRRAIAVAASESTLFVIGGMQEKGGPTTRVDLLDLKSKEWTTGPSIPGEPIAGFGAAALNHNGRIYVSTVEGAVYALSDDGKQWSTVSKYEPGRFFHRMVSVDENTIALIGGANMETGKLRETLCIPVSKPEESEK